MFQLRKLKQKIEHLEGRLSDYYWIDKLENKEENADEIASKNRIIIGLQVKNGKMSDW